MPNIDLLFYAILRFVTVAFVLLTMAWCVLRPLKQRLERVRLVQISLLTLVATTVLALGNLVPTIDLPVWPTSPSTTALVNETNSVASAADELPSTVDIPEGFLSPGGSIRVDPSQKTESPVGNIPVNPSQEADDSAKITQVDQPSVEVESAGDSTILPRLR